MIRVLIVEDQKIVLDGINSLLKNEENIEVVGLVSDGEEAKNSILNTLVDVALVDIEIPGLNGIELTQYIKDNQPEIKVVILSMHKHPEYIQAAIDKGADGYLLKDDTNHDEMVLAINEVADGNLYYSEVVTKINILGQRGNSKRSNQRAVLTPREKEVLKLLAEGQSAPKIGKKLHIAPSTVDTHRKHLLEKFEVANTILLVRKALEEGYL